MGGSCTIDLAIDTRLLYPCERIPTLSDNFCLKFNKLASSIILESTFFKLNMLAKKRKFSSTVI